MIDYRALFDLTGRAASVADGGPAPGSVPGRHGSWPISVRRVVCADLNTEGWMQRSWRSSPPVARRSVITADLTDKAAVAAALDAAEQHVGGLDIGVTTPGINIPKRVADFTDEEFDRIIELNLKGTFTFLQQASIRMAAQRLRHAHRLLVHLRALLVEPGLSVYAATKAAIQQMVRGLASEVGPQNVRVNSIAPGVIDTPLTRTLRGSPTS